MQTACITSASWHDAARLELAGTGDRFRTQGTLLDVCGFQKNVKKGKCSPYSIAERRVPERPVLGNQPADVSHKSGDRLPLLPPGLQLPLQPLRGSLPVSLLGE